MSIFRGPRIIEEGLVLALDSQDPRSYPGTGTTWYDLSPTQNHGTFSGGMSWDGQHMIFDGVDGYVGMGADYCNDGIIGTGNIDYSMEAWIYTEKLSGATTSGDSIIGNAGATGIGLQLFSSSGNKVNCGYRTNSNYYSVSNIALNTWYHLVETKIGFGSSFIYINGVEDFEFTATTSMDIDACAWEMQIGYAATRLSGRYKGKMAVVKLYKTALTAEDVAYLFNLQRGRFGL